MRQATSKKQEAENRTKGLCAFAEARSLGRANFRARDCVCPKMQRERESPADCLRLAGWLAGWLRPLRRSAAGGRLLDPRGPTVTSSGQLRSGLLFARHWPAGGPNGQCVWRAGGKSSLERLASLSSSLSLGLGLRSGQRASRQREGNHGGALTATAGRQGAARPRRGRRTPLDGGVGG